MNLIKEWGGKNPLRHKKSFIQKKNKYGRLDETAKYFGVMSAEVKKKKQLAQAVP
jgi:hypothetical protein